MDNPLARRFYFTVTNEPKIIDDQFAPRCEVIQNNYAESCKLNNDPSSCNLAHWIGRLKIQDFESGLRSIQETPDLRYQFDTFSSYDNFIIGSVDAAEYLAEISCCVPTVSIRIQGWFSTCLEASFTVHVISLGSEITLSKELG